MIKFSIDVLETHIQELSGIKFKYLIDQMREIGGKYDNWWGEQFCEDPFSSIGLSKLSLLDLKKDIKEDYFSNITDIETKGSIYWGRNINLEFGMLWGYTVNPELIKKWQKEGADRSIKKYTDQKKTIKYDAFIEKVINQILDSINSGLDFFRVKSFTHISFQNFGDRLINKSSENSYLFALYANKDASDGFYSFARDAIKLFNIDGFIEIKSHLNYALEANLVTNLEETDLIKEKDHKERDITKDYDPKNSWSSLNEFDIANNYCNNPRQNIADLGKGTANLIGLIIKVFSILYKYRKNKSKSGGYLKESIGQESITTTPKLILVEEPEAFLHPDWQTKLADFFVYCLNYNKELKVKFLIESHSVYFIQRLQYLVASKEIKSEDVNFVV